MCKHQLASLGSNQEGFEESNPQGLQGPTCMKNKRPLPLCSSNNCHIICSPICYPITILNQSAHHTSAPHFCCHVINHSSAHAAPPFSQSILLIIYSYIFNQTHCLLPYNHLLMSMKQSSTHTLHYMPPIILPPTNQTNSGRLDSHI